MRKLVRSGVTAAVGAALLGLLTAAPVEARPGPCPASFEIATLTALDEVYRAPAPTPSAKTRTATGRSA